MQASSSAIQSMCGRQAMPPKRGRQVCWPLVLHAAGSVVGTPLSTLILTSLSTTFPCLAHDLPTVAVIYLLVCLAPCQLTHHSWRQHAHSCGGVMMLYRIPALWRVMNAIPNCFPHVSLQSFSLGTNTQHANNTCGLFTSVLASCTCPAPAPAPPLAHHAWLTPHRSTFTVFSRACAFPTPLFNFATSRRPHVPVFPCPALPLSSLLFVALQTAACLNPRCVF